MEFLNQLLESFVPALRVLLTYIPGLPAYFCLFFFCYGAYITFLKGTSSYYKDIITEYFDTESEEDVLFVRTGVNITANKYTFMLYMFAVLIFLMFGIMSVSSGDIRQMLTGVIVAFLLVFFLRPQKFIFGDMKSPFVIITDAISKGRREEYDKELYNSITILKNLAIAQEGSPLSADLILEKLMENSKKLKPVYAEMLSIYRTGDKTKAIKYFADAIGTKNGRTIAMTFEKLDKINPSELKLQVISLQEIMAEERFTKGLEKAESRGNILYALATGCCFVCLLNFLFVCVIMDTLTMLGGVF
ncbi:MAG: hypothetical protein IJP00_01360 [Firmicutes bacterium]|nr:hypothetical protein [Bacillota bacterium]